MSKNIKSKGNDLKNIPGVGEDMEQHFFDIGIFTIDDLIGKNPEELFTKATPHTAVVFSLILR